MAANEHGIVQGPSLLDSGQWIEVKVLLKKPIALPAAAIVNFVSENIQLSLVAAQMLDGPPQIAVLTAQPRLPPS